MNATLKEAHATQAINLMCITVSQGCLKSAKLVYCMCRLEALTREKLAAEEGAAAAAKEREASEQAAADKLQYFRERLADEEHVRTGPLKCCSSFAVHDLCAC